MSSTHIESLNLLAARWAEMMWAVSWQFCVLGLVVLILHLSLRRAAPNWRYWLWQILAVKLLLMPFWTATAPWKWPASNPVAAGTSLSANQEHAPETNLADPPKPPPRAPSIPSPAHHLDVAANQVSPIPTPRAITSDSSELATSAVKPHQPDLKKQSTRAASRRESPVADAKSRPRQPGTPAIKPSPTNSVAGTRLQKPAASAVDSTPSSNAPTQGQGPVTTPSPAFPTLSGMVLIMFAWGATVLMLTARVIWQGLALSRRLRQTAAGDADLVARVRAAAAQLKMTRIPEVRVIELDVSPFVCGLWRPRLIVPEGLAQTFTSEQLDLVLLHELAHIRRQDLAWGWIPVIGKILFFYHPVVHFLCAQVRFERELACDQLAMQSSGRDAATYADTLVRVVGQFSGSDSFQLAASSPGLANPSQ